MTGKNRENNIPDAFANVSSKNTFETLAFRYLPFWPIFFIAIFI